MEVLDLSATENLNAVGMDKVQMPDQSGLDVLTQAARKRPGAARLLISGWPEQVPREQLAELGVFALLPKPWDDTELKQTLREALDSGR